MGRHGSPAHVGKDLAVPSGVSVAQGIADLAKQGADGVKYLKSWVDEKDHKVFCLVEAPDAETAARVHREGSCPVADRIPEVVEGVYIG